MKAFRWAMEKDSALRQERGISFEEIVVAIDSGGLLDIVAHPRPEKYPRQRIMVVEVAAYAYLVPFVEEEDHYFLKTVVPSRKATRDFITEGARDD